MSLRRGNPAVQSSYIIICPNTTEMPQSPMMYIKRYKPSKEELYRYESDSDSLSDDEEWVGGLDIC